MADNFHLDSTPPVGSLLTTRKVTYSGDANCDLQVIGVVDVSGADDAKTATDVSFSSILGSLTETAPANDTNSSGLNGRLQRIAQRITSLIALIPTALTASGNFKVAIVEDTAGSVTVTENGTITAGQVSVALVASLPYVWNGTAWVRGAWTANHYISAASTNATSVKASAGVVGSIVAGNANAAARYLKMYNKASAPTVGTDTPLKTYTLPPNQCIVIPPPAGGWTFTTGIAWALTTGAADNDTGAVALNELTVNLDWL